MRRYRITIGDDVFDVRILDDPRRGQVRVDVDGETFTVAVETVSEKVGIPEAAATPPAPSVSADASAPATNTVTAPLPGTIKAIAVRPGQHVTRGDELLIIEAMKMDNVIRAPREGTIGAIHVAEGRRIAYGAPLLDLAD